MDNTGESLLIFTRRQIAKTLASAFLLGGAQFSRHCANALGFSGEAVAAPAGSALATLTLVNSGGATQPSGVPTQTFGQPFKDGDIAPGTAPIFTVSGVTQPFSAGMQSYWRSGYLKFATFMLLPTFSSAPSASTTVTISKGGTWPAASSRTLAEVYAQSLMVSATPVSGRSTSFGAWLNGDLNTFPRGGVHANVSVSGTTMTINSITSGSQVAIGQYLAGSGITGGAYYIVSGSGSTWALNTSPGTLTSVAVSLYNSAVWLDGAAGKAWKITTNMAASAGAAADGALLCDHSIVALNNSSGGLGGYRWLGQLRQPFYNGTGPSPVVVAFQSGSPTWQATGRSAAAPPSAALAHTFSVTGTALSLTAPDWYLGAGDANVQPCLVSGTSLPAPLVAGQFVYAQVPASGVVTSLWNDPGTFSSGITFTSTGSGTLTPVLVLGPHNKITFATGNAQYNFFQGTGALTQDTTLRQQFDPRYMQSTRLVPPYDLSVTGAAFGGPLTESTLNYPWSQYNQGSFLLNRDGVGDHPDIGILPNLAVLHFYNRTANSDRCNRIIGLAGANVGQDITDAATDMPVNISPNTYAGLAASAIGTSVPVGTPIGENSTIPEHCPSYSYFAYLCTGEPQYLDTIASAAVTWPASIGPAIANPTPALAGIPTTLWGITTWYSEQRGMAWAHRDQQYAAMLWPWNPTAPNALDHYGSQMGLYLNQMADNSASFPAAQFANTTVYNSYVRASGFYMSWSSNLNGMFPGFPAVQTNWTFWENADFAGALAVAEIRNPGITNGILSSHIVTMWNKIGTSFGYWNLFSYVTSFAQYFTGTDGATVGGYAGHYQTLTTSSDPEWHGIITTNFLRPLSYGGPALTWAPNVAGGGSGPAFTLGPGVGARGWLPALGDKWTPWVGGNGVADPTDGSWPPEMAVNTNYYTVGLTGPDGSRNYHWDVSTTIGGAPLAISSTGNPPPLGQAQFALVAANPPALNWPFPEIYLDNLWQAACYINAIGVGGLASVIADNTNRMLNTPGGAHARYLPNLGTEAVDARYSTQVTYAS
jgi:hypothetical protein